MSSAYFDFEPLEEFVEYLLDHQWIEGEPRTSIARHVVAFGESSLSAYERTYYDKEIRPLMERDCETCGQRIELGLLPNAYANKQSHGVLCCFRCAHSAHFQRA